MLWVMVLAFVASYRSVFIIVLVLSRVHNKNREGECLTANTACTKSLRIIEQTMIFEQINTFTDDRNLLIGVEYCW